jgi:hypothetical protein
MQTSKSVHHLGNGGGDLGLVGHIACDGDCPFSGGIDLFRYLNGKFPTNVNNTYCTAFFGDPLAGTFTDPAPSTGDDDNFTFQSAHLYHYLSSRFDFSLRIRLSPFDVVDGGRVDVAQSFSLQFITNR